MGTVFGGDVTFKGVSQVAQSVKNLPVVQRHRRCWFDPWVGKIPSPGGGHGNPP